MDTRTLTFDPTKFKPNDRINPHTGEIEEMAEYKTVQQKNRDLNFRELQIKKQNFYKYIKENIGQFYFQKYKELLQVVNNDTATAFRFLYLCCFADEQGNIVYDNNFMTKQEDFVKIFKSNSTKKIMRDLKNKNLIYKDGRKFYSINMNYFSLGLPKNIETNTCTRTFKDSIKDLYLKSSITEHKTLGYIVKLLPYVNFYNNVICLNVNNRGEEDVHPLNKQEIVKILSQNINTGYKVLDKLEKSLIANEPVILKVEGLSEEHFIINPKLFYSGNNKKELRGVIEQFDIVKNQYFKRKARKSINKRIAEKIG